MTRTEFNSLCVKYQINYNIVIETIEGNKEGNKEIIQAIKENDTATIEKFLLNEF